MPFTVSHLAAALPFWPLRRVIPFTALAVGCATPDIVLFIPALVDYGVTYQSTHHWPTVIPNSLLLGWPLLLLVLVIIPAAHALLPQPIRCSRPSAADQSIWHIRPNRPVWETGSRLQTIRNVSLNTSLWALLSSIALMIGGLSHSVWDAFTHAYGWGVDALPCLQTTITLSESSPTIALRGYQIAQHLSSIVGLFILFGFYLLIVIRRRKQQIAPNNPPTLPIWIRVVVVAGLLLICPWLAYNYDYSPIIEAGRSRETAIFYWVTRTMMYQVWLLIAYSLLHYSLVYFGHRITFTNHRG